MLRSSPASSMQKTYDDCYLVCSTAIYFEQQNNEAEALRSWREALDQIYYHNAYKVPANYRPKTETERALQESLKDMELQCKERVDLLSALQTSRRESSGLDRSPTNGSSRSRGRSFRSNSAELVRSPAPGLGQGTVPAANYSNLSRPAVPHRPTTQPAPPPYSRTPEPLRTAAPPKPSNPNPFPTSGATLGPPSAPRRSSRTPSPDKRPQVLRPTLRKDGERRPTKMPATMRARAPVAAQAATLAWPNGAPLGLSQTYSNGSTTSLPPDPTYQARQPSGDATRPGSSNTVSSRTSHNDSHLLPPSPSDVVPHGAQTDLIDLWQPHSLDDIGITSTQPSPIATINRSNKPVSSLGRRPPPPPPRHAPQAPVSQAPTAQAATQAPPTLPPPPTSPQKRFAPGNDGPQPNGSPTKPTPPSFPTYRKEYPEAAPLNSKKVESMAATRGVRPSERSKKIDDLNPEGSPPSNSRSALTRKAVPPKPPQKPLQRQVQREISTSSSDAEPAVAKSKVQKPLLKEEPIGATSDEPAAPKNDPAEWDARVEHLMKNLPKGVDEQAAKGIFNEIVIKGDEVHWDDVAGLEAAKNALKEAVVYPFLRPDLFLGLREPARGMLLFGPPGTGKTMLARAVATESRSTFFAISASSLTSKFLGESEKLVRALFSLAKALAPSIIFVDEIDSLLSARAGSGEHEATRRIKTEFLIQWSDLAKAAAGRESSDKDGDATRVLVLAATNLPWAIDDAARRRFVRRQYIPLPEDHVREDQLRRLMSAQKHGLNDSEIQHLVDLTDGFSGSDITALAKDAAMGPLRSLGERLLHMSPDEIRPIMFEDFEASLINIRPSVSKQGLKEFEDWAREFGERGG